MLRIAEYPQEIFWSIDLIYVKAPKAFQLALPHCVQGQHHNFVAYPYAQKVALMHIQCAGASNMIMALTAGILIHSHWGLSIISGLDYWNGLLEWTTGLTIFALKIIFIAYNEIFLLVHPLNGRFLT